MSTNERQLNELALFAGAGGGILGSQLLGHRIIAAVEIESYCREILLRRQEEKILKPFPIWDDVTTFDGKPWCGKVDIVSGGFPCQDISCAGKGEGITGNRSGLWKEMARIIYEVQPSIVWVENSPLLISRGLTTVLSDLAEMGYDAQWCIVSAADVGAIHKRARLWLFAYTNQGRQLAIQAERKNIEQRPLYSEPNRVYSTLLSEKDFSEISRNPDVMARWVDRLKAIGNGQVPQVVATAWNILSNERKTK